MIEALFSGAIDASFIGPNPAINGFAKSDGEALRIVSGTTSGGASLVVREGITTAADLKGTTLATPSLGNTQDVALRAWLKDQGLSADTEGGGDVSIQPQENADTLTTFIDGTIDGAWVPEPWATRLILEGKGHTLVDEKTLWDGGQFVTTHLIVSTKYLDEHPDLVEGLLVGPARLPRPHQGRPRRRPHRDQRRHRGHHRQAAEGRDDRRGVAEPHLHLRPRSPPRWKARRRTRWPWACWSRWISTGSTSSGR